jgi:hypothetical protein
MVIKVLILPFEWLKFLLEYKYAELMDKQCKGGVSRDKVNTYSMEELLNVGIASCQACGCDRCKEDLILLEQAKKKLEPLKEEELVYCSECQSVCEKIEGTETYECKNLDCSSKKEK